MQIIRLKCLMLILKCVYGMSTLRRTQSTCSYNGSLIVSHWFNNRKVVSLSCSPSGSKFVYATSSSQATGGSRLSAMYLVSSWRPQDVKMNSGTLAVLDMKSNAKEVTDLTG